MGASLPRSMFGTPNKNPDFGHTVDGSYAKEKRDAFEAWLHSVREGEKLSEDVVHKR